jgi:hypothetical protein
MGQLRQDFPALVDGLSQFRNSSERFESEKATIESIGSTNNKIWQLLKLPMVFFSIISNSIEFFPFFLIF